jgi:trehalose 6-phosphate synthase/phosphatase
VASSRGRKTLESWYGRLPLHLIGQRGCELRLAGDRQWQTLLPDADESWMPRVRDVLEDYAARTPGAWVESMRGALAWHYRQVEPGFGRWQARELASHLAEAFPHSPMEVIHGARVVEVRHQGLHKGAALNTLLRERPGFDFLLVAGDDRSDEDMFAAVPESAWTIKIGPGPTRARFRLARPMGLRTLLEHLVPGHAEDAAGAPPVPAGGGR